MSATVLGGALGQWPTGYLSDRTDRRKVLVGCCVVSGTAGLLIAFLPGLAGGWVCALGALWGAEGFCLYSISVAHTNDYAKPHEFVQVSSGLLLIYAGGAVAGPVVASAAMTSLGSAMLFAFTGCVHALLAAFALWRMSRRAAAPVSEHVPFAESLAAATTISTAFDAAIQASYEDGTQAAGGEGTASASAGEAASEVTTDGERERGE